MSSRTSQSCATRTIHVPMLDDERADETDAVVTDSERDERPGSLVARPSAGSRCLREHPCSYAVSSPPADHPPSRPPGSRRERSSGVGGETMTHRPSCGRGFIDGAALGEAVDRAGHARGRHLLDVGEFPAGPLRLRQPDEHGRTGVAPATTRSRSARAARSACTPAAAGWRVADVEVRAGHGYKAAHYLSTESQLRPRRGPELGAHSPSVG